MVRIMYHLPGYIVNTEHVYNIIVQKRKTDFIKPGSQEAEGQMSTSVQGH